MAHYDRHTLSQELWDTIPTFFPEIKNKDLTKCLSVGFLNNSLILYISFYKGNINKELEEYEAFDLSKFSDNLDRFNKFLKLIGIYPLDKDILPHTEDPVKNEETYYYAIL